MLVTTRIKVSYGANANRETGVFRFWYVASHYREADQPGQFGVISGKLGLKLEAQSASERPRSGHQHH
jgi:hypothetical protein